MDWCDDYSHLPFVCGDAGGHGLTKQPTGNAWGSHFADAMAVELTPVT